MKKLMFLAVIAMVLTVFNACQKESIDMQENESSEVEFAKTRLTEIGNKILSISIDPILKSCLYEEVKKQFDGDYNVLISDVDKALKSESSSLNKCINKVLKSAKIETENLTILKDKNGENYYPQIYIPFFEELMRENIIGVKPPIIVVFISGVDDSKEEFEGYINSEGEAIKLDYKITEDIARKNEVWVISINERVDDAGNVIENFYKLNQLKSAVSPINIKLEYMKIKSHKESWAAGKSEVHIKANRIYKLPSMGTAGSDRFADDNTGYEIRQFSRDDVDYERNILLNYNLQWNWDVDDWDTDPIGYVFIIFEYDGWPTGWRQEYTWDLPTEEGYWFTFRSADPSYFIGTIYGNTHDDEFASQYAGSFTYYSSEIEFNTKLY